MKKEASMSKRSLISLIAACAFLTVAAFPAGTAFAKKKSDEDSATLSTCTGETGAFPVAEAEDDRKGGKPPPGQIGGKPAPGQIGANSDDDDCEIGALPARRN